jgi:VRR-NUC domain-containing protein
MGIRFQDLSDRQRAMINGALPVEKPIPEKETRGEMRLERQEQKVFANYLLLHGYMPIWHRTDKPTGCAAGVPDFVIPISHGRIAWFEFKLPGKKLSKDQEKFRQYLESVGHKLFVVYSAQEAIQVLKKL